MLKEKSQKPTKKLSLKTLTNKELKQVNGGSGGIGKDLLACRGADLTN